MKRYLVITLLLSMFHCAAADPLFPTHDYSKSFFDGFTRTQNMIEQQMRMQQLRREQEEYDERQRIITEQRRQQEIVKEREKREQREHDVNGVSRFLDEHPEYMKDKDRYKRLETVAGKLIDGGLTGTYTVFTTAHNIIAQQDQDTATFEAFCRRHPIFTIESSLPRQYGDYTYVKKYVDKVNKGHLDYADALNLTALAVKEIFPNIESSNLVLATELAPAIPQKAYSSYESFLEAQKTK